MPSKKVTPETLKKLGTVLRKIERPDLSEDEALELELVEGCRLKNVNTDSQCIFIDFLHGKILYLNISFGETRCLPKEDLEILGLPITLSRILSEILNVNHYIYFDGQALFYDSIDDCGCGDIHLEQVCNWKSFKENSPLDATAEDQEEKDIQEIIKILSQN